MSQMFTSSSVKRMPRTSSNGDLQLVREAQNVFNAIDHGNTGSIDKWQLRDYVEDEDNGSAKLLGIQRGSSSDVIDELFDTLDTDHDGKLTLEEWKSGFQQLIHDQSS
ncbi:hypothetical protein CYMTET_52704 [Cymbomonas tetramitiformis]|uniref:EF-hand domain-containing protein n=1 Tax=Cymbomonas tetramitiformis TaxID=36881 RepID=A0AAE0ERD1_9CHLO|nr:hypothetical protein CYMTET_52704 [Cymbomonas tetramitiformis]